MYVRKNHAMKGGEPKCRRIKKGNKVLYSDASSASSKCTQFFKDGMQKTAAILVHSAQKITQ